LPDSRAGALLRRSLLSSALNV